MTARASLSLAFLLPAALTGCVQDKVAGGSSEVDNPILVAFVDGAGAGIEATGSLSVYLADQNPALNPEPILRKQILGRSSVLLSARDFTQATPEGASRNYNLLLIGDDSTGSLVRNLSYQPGRRRYLLDSANVDRVTMPLTPLIRYTASLDVAGDSGLVRVIVPGTPFQSVVVDSTFVIEGVPRGDLAFHVLGGDGSERPLAPPAAGPADPPHFTVDSAHPPIQRPPPPPRAEPLVVRAGTNRSIPSGPSGTAEFLLSGTVQGANPLDPRLAVLWRQVQGPQGARASLETPSSLKTAVSFPRPGVYQFVLTAVFESQRSEDTVSIGVQPPPERAVFLEPSAGDTVWLGRPFEIFWEGERNETLSLDVTRDGGATWQPIAEGVQSRVGLNKRTWMPQGAASQNARLRLRNGSGGAVSLSATFLLLPPAQHPAPPPAAKRTASGR